MSGPPATEPIRFGVLGVGRIGSMHADLLANRVDKAHLIGVYDVASEAAEKAATTVGARPFTSVEELLGDTEIDAVVIATSTDTHVDLMVQAAEAGKHIFCEKPIALDLQSVDRGLAAVDEAGVSLHVGFNRRFDPGHAAVRAAVADGTLGRLRQVRITSRDPAPPPLAYIEVSGGIFRDMTIHDFDMARFVTGSEVVEVYARGDVRVDPEIGAAGDLDTVVAVLTHEDGTLTMIDNCREATYGYDQRVEAFGSGGVASSENHLDHQTTIRTADGGRSATVPYFFLERYVPSYVAQWQAFIDAVSHGRPMPVTGADGRAPLVIGLAAQRSVREQRPVPLHELE